MGTPVNQPVRPNKYYGWCGFVWKQGTHSSKFDRYIIIKTKEHICNRTKPHSHVSRLTCNSGDIPHWSSASVEFACANWLSGPHRVWGHPVEAGQRNKLPIDTRWTITGIEASLGPICSMYINLWYKVVLTDTVSFAWIYLITHIWINS